MTSWIRRERLLIGVAVWGFVQAATIAVALVARGRYVAPAGDLVRAASGATSLGIFTLTTAFALSISPLADAERRRYRWVLAYVVGYAYVFELVQGVRGLDARFSYTDTVVDTFFRNIFQLNAYGYLLLALVLAWAFARPFTGASARVLGIRYALASLVLGFGAGFLLVFRYLMSPFEPRSTDPLLVHAVGLHGFEILVVSTLVLERAARGTRWIHATGAAYVTGLIALWCGVLLEQPLRGGLAGWLGACGIAGALAIAATGAVGVRAGAHLAWLKPRRQLSVRPSTRAL
jgi:hypothetical protein